MKIITPLIITVFSLPVLTHAKSLQNWEQCRDKVGNSIDITEVGRIGYEQELIRQCGDRPVTPIAANRLGESLPFDVVQAAPWAEQFKKLTGKGYTELKSSLTVSSKMQGDGDWMVGSGHDPQGGNSSKAVIAINTKTNKVIAVYADVAGELKLYGFNHDSKGVPEKIWQWLSSETGAG